MPLRKLRLGGPLYPNAGIADVYRKRLDSLIDEMNASLSYWLISRWKLDPPEPKIIATDDTWMSGLRRTMRELERRWQSKFDEMAPKLATYFAEQAGKRSTETLKRILDEGGMTVEFRMSPYVRMMHQAVVDENVGLIKSIAQEHLADVRGIVMRSVTTGRDLEQLSTELRARSDVPKQRAALISRDQNNKATAVITRARQQEAGITKAVWMHSHAGKHPRPEHLAFSQGNLSGPVYETEKGAFLEDKWVWPGTEINCRCFSRPVLPGF